jgi:hypothetical protein
MIYIGCANFRIFAVDVAHRPKSILVAASRLIVAVAKSAKFVAAI